MKKIRGEAECGLECQERLPKRSKTWPGGRSRNNSDRLGKKGKEFQVNSSVPKGLTRDPELVFPTEGHGR